jgi:hypothetical protein
MFFTIADLQHRLPVAAPIYETRTCGKSFGIHEDIPDGAVFTSIVSIGHQWDGNRIVAHVYRGANGHFFVERIAPNGRGTGEIDRVERSISAYAVNACVPHVLPQPR